MSVVNMLDHHSKQPRPTGVIAHIEDRQRLEYLLADGFVAVIVRSGGDIVSAHRSYEEAFAARPDPDPIDGVEFIAADLHELLYGEESD
jgi:hypothetical protein